MDSRGGAPGEGEHVEWGGRFRRADAPALTRGAAHVSERFARRGTARSFLLKLPTIRCHRSVWECPRGRVAGERIDAVPQCSI